MADLAQWTADQFWGQIQWVAAQGRQQKARLDQQKLTLQGAYAAAKARADQAAMSQLEPLIHKNSEMRVRWAGYRDQFNRLVAQARSFLAARGIAEPPVLSGIGLAPVVVPVLWITALVAVVAIIHEINAGINAVNQGIAKLGPIGSTALALTPLLLGGLALWFVWPKLLARRAA